MEEGLRKQENGPETLDYLSDEDAQRKSKYALLWYIGGAILAAIVLAFIIWCGVEIHRQIIKRREISVTSRGRKDIESDDVLHSIIILGDAKGMHFGFGLQSYF